MIHWDAPWQLDKPGTGKNHPTRRFSGGKLKTNRVINLKLVGRVPPQFYYYNRTQPRSSSSGCSRGRFIECDMEEFLGKLISFRDSILDLWSDKFSPSIELLTHNQLLVIPAPVIDGIVLTSITASWSARGIIGGEIFARNSNVSNTLINSIISSHTLATGVNSSSFATPICRRRGQWPGKVAGRQLFCGKWTHMFADPSSHVLFAGEI